MYKLKLKIKVDYKIHIISHIGFSSRSDITEQNFD